MEGKFSQEYILETMGNTLLESHNITSNVKWVGQLDYLNYIKWLKSVGVTYI